MSNSKNYLFTDLECEFLDQIIIESDIKANEYGNNLCKEHECVVLVWSQIGIEYPNAITRDAELPLERNTDTPADFEDEDFDASLDSDIDGK